MGFEENVRCGRRLQRHLIDRFGIRNLRRKNSFEEKCLRRGFRLNLESGFGNDFPLWFGGFVSLTFHDFLHANKFGVRIGLVAAGDDRQFVHIRQFFTVLVAVAGNTVVAFQSEGCLEAPLNNNQKL